jgi:membrane protein YdbS with pleckstrin-like domain
MSGKEAMFYKPYKNPKAILYGTIFIIIVAIPISRLIYLFLEGSLIFTITLSAVMLAVLLLFTYLTFFGKNLNYELSAQEIKVNFGLLKKKNKLQPDSKCRSIGSEDNFTHSSA